MAITLDVNAHYSSNVLEQIRLSPLFVITSTLFLSELHIILAVICLEIKLHITMIYWRKYGKEKNEEKLRFFSKKIDLYRA